MLQLSALVFMLGITLGLLLLEIAWWRNWVARQARWDRSGDRRSGAACRFVIWVTVTDA